MQSRNHNTNHLGPIGSASQMAGGTRRPEVFSYLFFMGLIASTFFI